MAWVEKDHSDHRVSTPLLWAGSPTTVAFQYLKRAYKQEVQHLFTRVDSDRTREKGFKLRQGRFRLNIRRKFWNRLPKEVVDAPSLEAFKARLDVALGSLV